MSFIDATIAGFILAAIIGPIAILCMNLVISHGFYAGIAVGVGASLADATYALLAALGMTAVSDFMDKNDVYVKLIGAAFLLYLAYCEIKKPIEKSKHIEQTGYLKMVWQTYLLTMASPFTIVTFMAVFATFGEIETGWCAISMIVMGFLFGGMLWWTIWAGVIAKIRHALSPMLRNKLKLASGMLLAGFALYAIVSAV